MSITFEELCGQSLQEKLSREESINLKKEGKTSIMGSPSCLTPKWKPFPTNTTTFVVMVSVVLLFLVAAAAAADSSSSGGGGGIIDHHHDNNNHHHPPKIPKACEPPHDQYPFCDNTLPLDKRLDDLIGRLTLEEKPFLLTARESPKGNISRLGIPEFDWGGNCMHGVESRCAPPDDKGRIRCATSFPNPNTLGPTYNGTVWKGMANIIGLELRALWLQNVGENHGDNLPHIGLDCWSPNIGIVRDPRWGRNMETPSEDPYLCGVYGRLHTIGLQNSSLDDRYLQAVATLKHYDANSLEGPHWTPDGIWDRKNGTLSRHNFNAKISLHDLSMSYLPAFQQAVVGGGAAGIMCSYNSINGIPVCANEYLLQKVLRREWKFRGYISSDSSALQDIVKEHKYAKDWEEMVPLALQAGCDIESAPWHGGHPHSTGGAYIDYIPKCVKDGLVDEALVDRAVRNALETRFRLGLFDPLKDQPFWQVSPEVIQAPEHIQMAKEATAQGLVLLKNENNLLPLKTTSDSIALIGPHIHDRKVMAGNYLGELCPGSNYKCITSFLEGFSNATSKYGVKLVSALGCSVFGDDSSGFQQAIKVASEAKVVVFLGGLNGTLEAEGRDRPDIRLPPIQAELIKAVAKVNPNIVLVLMHGGMVALDSVIDTVPAVISAGYPGRYAGEVLPDVLMGKNERAWGKLAISWYHDNFTDQFNMMDFAMSKPPGRTHRYFTGKPQFPFGHGLNPLTSFSLEELQVRRHQDDSSELEIWTTVTNTGKRAGDEVVLAFFEPPSDLPAYEPASKLRQQLFDFERLHLKPGESKKVSTKVELATLQLYDADGIPATFAGKYVVKFSTGNKTVRKMILVDNQAGVKVLQSGQGDDATTVPNMDS